MKSFQGEAEQAARGIAAEVRAEMARQGKFPMHTELAEVLGITSATASRRLTGEVPFDVVELLTVAMWLGVDASRFLPAEIVKAAG